MLKYSWLRNKSKFSHRGWGAWGGFITEFDERQSQANLCIVVHPQTILVR